MRIGTFQNGKSLIDNASKIRSIVHNIYIKLGYY